MTLEWSAVNLMISSDISTCTLFEKLMARRSWHMGRVELATARKMGGCAAPASSMANINADLVRAGTNQKPGVPRILLKAVDFCLPSIVQLDPLQKPVYGGVSQT